MPRKSNPSSSVKQILWRDFNWRMGNLRRLMENIKVLTEDRDIIVAQLIQAEIVVQKRLHEDRLAAVEQGDMAYDLVTFNACHELGRMKRARD
jgi:hypothetical protein